MKAIAEFLSELRRLDIKLWVEGDRTVLPQDARLRSNAPSGAMTPELRTQIKDRKAEIVEFLCQEERASSSEYQPIQAVPRESNLPLSFAQQRLWFLEQFQPNTALYSMARALKLNGILNESVLKKALAEIVARHESLRTTFVTQDGIQFQVIAEDKLVELPKFDLSQLPLPEQQASVEQLFQQQAVCPFDLSQDLMLRATLLRLGDTEHILVLVMHHIASDGWSMGILFNELAALYNGYLMGQACQLPALPIQYADFALWQRQWLSSQVLENQLDYWKQQLADAPPLLELPTDRVRPAIQSFKGARYSCVLPAPLTSALKTLSQLEGVTLFMTLLAAFKTLLYRLSGQSDLVVGSPIAGRHQLETEGLIGFFVNTLVLRTRVQDDATFQDLLTQVRSVALGAYAHQDLPFEKLVEELQPERSRNHTPLFQVMFALQNASSSDCQLSGLSVNSLSLERGTAKFDLTLSMKETELGLSGSWEYNTDLFDAATIQRMAVHFQTLLEAIVANPEQKVAQLPLLTSTQRHQLLVEWNNTKVDYPQDKCIHQLFEAQVERTPDAVAVVFEDEQLSYRQLNARANQLAHYLQQLGVKPEVLVGLCVERSLEMVVGVLGILKAGGAYVPLDPAYPRERLALMLEDTRSPVLLTKSRWRSLLPEPDRVVCLDEQWEVIAQQPATNPKSPVEPNNLLYVIYTSGSTGRPKGITLSHQALGNLIHWHLETMEQGVGVLQFASLSFDASFHEMFAAWCSGGTLYMITENLQLDVDKLVHFLAKKPIQKVILPVALWQQIAQVYGQQAHLLGNLTEVVTTGEQLLLTQPIIDLFKQLNHCRLHNHYGPSETHVVTSFTFNDSPDTWPVYPPIGKPIANTQIYILDQHWQPVPIGVSGFLFIGGANLARGYLNRPDLTAQKFVSNPFGKGQLYQTGDLARYLSDGNIEYLGRIDNQVKLRGFRIELSEIETVLTQHPKVHQAVAIVREDVPGDKRLVAYMVTKPQQAATTGELRRFLKQKLPDYMVPSVWVELDQLPLTPNGKIDRRALPTPSPTRTTAETFVPPRTPIEEILANIWTKILNVEPIGIHDNFFELGGHSLKVTQVVSRIRQALGVELAITDLFEYPSIATLAENLEQKLHWQPNQQTPLILQTPREGNLPLSFAQQRLWFLEQFQPNTALYNIAQTLKLNGLLNYEALKKALAEIVARHESLRTTFVTQDETQFQVIAEDKSVELPVIDLSQLPELEKLASVEQLSQQQAVCPFDLSQDLMLRATLLRLGAREHILVLVMHHIASDGWSMGIFFNELAALYNAYLTGVACQLPELPIQYADFAYWQRQPLYQEILNTQLAYWKQQLEGIPALLELPTDRVRPAIQSFKGARHSCVLPAPLTGALKTLSQLEGVTLFMTLLAAFKTLLYRLSGQSDLVVGSPIAGRHQIETEGLIGFFVNTLVLRTRFQDDATFRDLLTNVRSVALGAYAHQDLPFEKLVEELQPERNLSNSPLFQVWFNMLSLGENQLQLSGLAVEPLPISSSVSKFDLTLYVREQQSGIKLEWVYNQDLFNPETIAWMTLHFRTLLEAIVANPEQPIANLPLFSETERQRLRNCKNSVRPNKLFTEFASSAIEQSIPARFEEQVRNYPHNIAIHSKNHQWTYSSLNQKANAIAQTLWQRNPDASERIALLLEHDAPAIAAILGVLKAGKTYVPLDPNYPQLRLTYILEDAQAIAILTNNNNLAIAQELTSGTIQLINIDEIDLENSWNDANRVIPPDTLAYILYTSGSAGQPKGVIQNHRNVLHFIRNYTNNLHIAADDKLTLLSSYSFDAAVMDIFGALLNGATLCPIDIKTEGLTHLADWLRQQEITIYHSTPTIYRHFLETLPVPIEESETPFPRIRLVVLGGEEVVKKDVDLYKQHFSADCIFVNGLGPTESTVNLQYLIDKQTENYGNLVSVGYPVEETKILLVNSAGINTEVYGEIAIRSPYIALGYWQKPQLTQAVFLPDPEGGNRRIYRTGDLGRLRADGTIEFLGRKDFQVKIRGFRIELGEIENVLSQHPEVREAVVIARPEKSGDKQLVAYVVPKQEKPLLSTLRSFLKQKLPDYMIPTAFVVLESLPLNPNGKLDRRALPSPDKSNYLETSFVPPRDAIESQLAQIWSSILDVHPVGVTDNFFAIGGHSILAVRLMAKIEQLFGKTLPLATVFQFPTIEELANLLRSAKDASKPSSLVPIQPQGNKSPFFCIHAIGGDVFSYADLASHLGSDQPFYGLQALGLNGECRPLTRIEDMAATYIKAMHCVQPDGPYQLGGWSFGGVVAFEMAIQLKASGHKVSRLALFDSYAPTPMSKASLNRDEVQLLVHWTKQLSRLLDKALPISVNELRLMGKFEERLNYVLEQAKIARIFPPEIKLEQVQQQFEVWRANSIAKLAYIPGFYPGRIILFSASKKSLTQNLDPTLGWGELATAGIEVHKIDGDHFNLVRSQVLAKELKAYLSQGDDRL